MADNAVTVRTRKFLRNAILKRRQCIVDVLHPGRANVSKKELQEKIGSMFKCKDNNTIVLFGFRTAFGGGKSSGFACIYDDLEAAKKYAKPYHLWRLGITEMPTKKGRKGIKEAKNRGKKVRGLGRRVARKKERRSQ